MPSGGEKTLFKLILSGLLLSPLSQLAAPTVLAGGTSYVNAIIGKDGNNCMTFATACKTIGHALSLASSGDTISIADGTYKENLNPNKNLTLKGASLSSTIIDGHAAGRVINVPKS